MPPPGRQPVRPAPRQPQPPGLRTRSISMMTAVGSGVCSSTFEQTRALETRHPERAFVGVGDDGLGRVGRRPRDHFRVVVGGDDVRARLGEQRRVPPRPAAEIKDPRGFEAQREGGNRPLGKAEGEWIARTLGIGEGAPEAADHLPASRDCSVHVVWWWAYARSVGRSPRSVWLHWPARRPMSDSETTIRLLAPRFAAVRTRSARNAYFATRYLLACNAVTYPLLRSSVRLRGGDRDPWRRCLDQGLAKQRIRSGQWRSSSAILGRRSRTTCTFPSSSGGPWASVCHVSSSSVSRLAT